MQSAREAEETLGRGDVRSGVLVARELCNAHVAEVMSLAAFQSMLGPDGRDMDDAIAAVRAEGFPPPLDEFSRLLSANLAKLVTRLELQGEGCKLCEAIEKCDCEHGRGCLTHTLISRLMQILGADGQQFPGTLCRGHWNELQQGLRDRGLERFVLSDPLESAFARSKGRYCAMGNTIHLVLHAAQSKLGVLAFVSGCPACLLRDTCDCGAAECGARAVIPVCLELSHERAVELGLIVQS